VSGVERSLLGWIGMGLVVALVATNVVFLLLLRTGGLLIGAVFYAVLWALVWRGRQRDYRSAMVGGILGLAVHVVEVVMMGWSIYPILMALNLILPALLVPVAWLAGRQAQQLG
jgi:hypothetical protein